MGRYRHFALLLLLVLASCGSAEEGIQAGDCTDTADNDGDGVFDCKDSGCTGSPDCAEAIPTAEGQQPGDCADGADNDGDGSFDCLDSGCEGASSCVTSSPGPEGQQSGECTDRADNDGDGDFDCQDSGCANSPDCIEQHPTQEGQLPGGCADGADNDGNGLFDCSDTSCAGSPDCDGSTHPAQSCGNGIVEGTEACEPTLMPNDVECSSLDPKFISGTLACDAQCQISFDECTAGGVCGNNTQEVGEECDDGNIESADGCTATCLLEDFSAAEGQCGETESAGAFGGENYDTALVPSCDDPETRDTYTPNSPLVIRLRFHVVWWQNVWPAAFDTSLVTWAQELRMFYIPTNVSFEWGDEGDYDEIFNNSWYDLNDSEFNALTAWNNDPAAIDIYFVNSYTATIDGDAKPVCGRTREIGPEAESLDSVVVVADDSCGSATLSHELGHAFALWHTQRELSGDTPDSSGDLCGDTPFDPGPSESGSTCSLNSTPTNGCCVTTCDGEGGYKCADGSTPDIFNPMSYYTCGDLPLRGAFTANQNSRMRCYLFSGYYSYSFATCADGDLDGYGATANVNCTHPQPDCNDKNPDINPLAAEACGNSIDENCDGLAASCAQVDGDGDHYAIEDGDCDDSNPSVHPGAVEICDNDLDDNCMDGDLSCSLVDQDGDGISASEGDCNDLSALEAPGLPEVSDGLDNDCDGEVDESSEWSGEVGELVVDALFADFRTKLLVGDDGVLHAATQDLVRGQSVAIYLRNGGDHWETEVLPANLEGYPSIAVRPDGTVLLAARVPATSPGNRIVIWQRDPTSGKWSYFQEALSSSRGLIADAWDLGLNAEGTPTLAIRSSTTCYYLPSNGTNYGLFTVGSCTDMMLLEGGDGTPYLVRKESNTNNLMASAGTRGVGEMWTFSSTVLGTAIQYGWAASLDPTGMLPRVSRYWTNVMYFDRFDGQSWVSTSFGVGNGADYPQSLVTLSDDTLCILHYESYYANLLATCSAGDMTTAWSKPLYGMSNWTPLAAARRGQQMVALFSDLSKHSMMEIRYQIGANPSLKSTDLYFGTIGVGAGHSAGNALFIAYEAEYYSYGYSDLFLGYGGDVQTVTSGNDILDIGVSMSSESLANVAWEQLAGTNQYFANLYLRRGTPGGSWANIEKLEPRPETTYSGLLYFGSVQVHSRSDGGLYVSYNMDTSSWTDSGGAVYVQYRGADGRNTVRSVVYTGDMAIVNADVDSNDELWAVVNGHDSNGGPGTLYRVNEDESIEVATLPEGYSSFQTLRIDPYTDNPVLLAPLAVVTWNGSDFDSVPLPTTHSYYDFVISSGGIVQVLGRYGNEVSVLTGAMDGVWSIMSWTHPSIKKAFMSRTDSLGTVVSIIDDDGLWRYYLGD